MKIVCWLGVAAMATAGCANWDQSDEVIDPTVSVVSLTQDRSPATVDMPLAARTPTPTPSAPVDPLVNTTAQPRVDDPACVNVPASAGSMSAADTLGACARGMLTAEEDGHYFTFSPAPDVSYRVTLAHSGAATFDVGTISTADGRPTCTPFSPGLVDARVTATADSRPLCVIVRAGGEAQGFTITAVP